MSDTLKTILATIGSVIIVMFLVFCIAMCTSGFRNSIYDAMNVVPEKEYNQELYNAELEQEFTYEEIEDMKEKQMTPDEYRQLYKGGPKLVREKKDNKGYSLALPIFIITEFIAVLFILMQIILL